MKNKITFLLILLPTLLMSQTMNVISFNIRYNNPKDGENAWPNRIKMVSGVINFHDASVFGLQEALLEQIQDLEKELPGYSWFGVGRDDGKTRGEYCPIFYDKNRYTLEENGQFWLSDDCDKPGLGWDAACNRLTTWGKLKEKKSGNTFLMLNTHFDHRGKKARINSALLMQEKVKELSENGKIPVILTGDFNLTPDTEAIATIKSFMQDSREITEEPPYGPVGTFSGFKWDAPLDKRIDYIFVKGNIRVLEYSAISDSREKRYPSDHLPVFVEVSLEK